MKKYVISLILVLLIAVWASAASTEDNTSKLDLNKVTLSELAKVPGLNESLAKEIIALRDENGEFVDMAELLDVDGIDNKLLRQISKHVFIEGAADCNC